MQSQNCSLSAYHMGKSQSDQLNIITGQVCHK